MESKQEKPKKVRVVSSTQDNKCPKKEGDNCLVPGVYSDSEPIGGG